MDTEIISNKAANVAEVNSPGKRTVYSMCGMCAVRCPIEVTVEDGKAVWIQGNTNDPAIGASLCAKGSAGLALEYDDDQRPQTPLIRKGPRGSGQWKRASWDEALDYITDKLKETIDVYGNKGIVMSDRGGFFNDLTKTFVKALGSPNYFNHDAGCAGNAHNSSRSIYGFPHERLLIDLKRTKHVVLYGRNILESLMVKEAKAFTEALANGMKCTYIDPRASITACKSTEYWMVRPNSDYALNLALIHEILKTQVYDKEFVDRYVSGMDYLREAVKDTSPEWQEQHTGLTPDKLRAFVKQIAAEAPHVAFHPGWMTARHKQSFYVTRTILILNALMGNIEIQGGIIITKTPEFYGRKGLKHLVDRVPHEVHDPRVDGAGIARPSWDPEIGMLHQAFAAMETESPYGLGAYIAYRHDPLTGLPDPEATKKALNKMKLVVSIDVRYSETGWYSDVILPETTYLERANLLAQINAPIPLFTMRDQAIAPRFNSRPAWWIFREILNRMEINEVLNFETIEELWNYQLEGTGITIDEMREKGFVDLTDTQKLFSRESLEFPTPSGKIEIESDMLKKAGFESLPPYQAKDAPKGNDFNLLFGRTGSLAHGQSLNNPILNGLAPQQVLWIHPDRADPLGIKHGNSVEVNGGSSYTGTLKANVTPWIHRDAVFMLHGYGATVPLATRAKGVGVADQRLQTGQLHDFDPAGGGCAMTEKLVQIKPVIEKGTRQ